MIVILYNQKFAIDFGFMALGQNVIQNAFTWLPWQQVLKTFTPKNPLKQKQHIFKFKDVSREHTFSLNTSRYYYTECIAPVTNLVSE